MLRLSLKWKFSALLACFGVTISTIMVLNYRTSGEVTTRLHQVGALTFPQYLQTTSLLTDFEEMTSAFRDAVVTGESFFLEKSTEKKKKFLRRMDELMETVPAERGAELQEQRDRFSDYYRNALALAELLIQCEEENKNSEHCYELAGDLPQAVSTLKQELDADLTRLHEAQERKVDKSLAAAMERQRAQ